MSDNADVRCAGRLFQRLAIEFIVRLKFKMLSLYIHSRASQTMARLTFV